MSINVLAGLLWTDKNNHIKYAGKCVYSKCGRYAQDGYAYIECQFALESSPITETATEKYK